MIRLQGQGENPDRWYSPRAVFDCRIWLNWCKSSTDSIVWNEEDGAVYVCTFLGALVALFIIL